MIDLLMQDFPDVLHRVTRVTTAPVARHAKSPSYLEHISPKELARMVKKDKLIESSACSLHEEWTYATTTSAVKEAWNQKKIAVVECSVDTLLAYKEAAKASQEAGREFQLVGVLLEADVDVLDRRLRKQGLVREEQSVGDEVRDGQRQIQLAKETEELVELSLDASNLMAVYAQAKVRPLSAP